MLRIAYSPIYKYELPEGHRFPMIKYELLPEQLLYEGTVSEANFFHPEPAAEEVITRTHEPGYWNRLKNLELSEKEIRAIGFPFRKYWYGVARTFRTARCNAPCTPSSTEWP